MNTSENEIVPTSQGCRPLARTIRRFSKAFLFSCVLLPAVFLGGVAKAVLIEEWTGDHYVSGSWTDDVSAVVASSSGSPLAVSNSFGTHTGVNVNGGYFKIAAGSATSGLSNFTIVVVIRPAAVGPNTGNYYNATPLVAYDITGSGQDDVGVSWAGVSVVDGAGQQKTGGNVANGDILQTSGYLALNVTHAVAYQVNGVALTVTTYADGALVASNPAVNINPRSSAQIAYVGGGDFGAPSFPGVIAAIQIYNDATNNAAALTQNLLNTYAPSPITLPLASGAAVGQSAPVTIGVPPAAVQNGSLTVTLTSATPSVVANTTVLFAKGQASVTTNLPVLALGSSTVTASASGLTPATILIAGLDYSGLVNDWLADDYTNNSTVGWIDSVGGIVAAGTGQEIAVSNVFGTHQGVARNSSHTTTGASGFIIPNSNPAATAPMGLTNYTVAVAFMPLTEGPTSDNYYSDDIMFGYDIGGAGQADFGISWGNGNGAGTGFGVCDGLGTATANVDSINFGLAYPLTLNRTHVVAVQVNGAAKMHTLYVDGVQVIQDTNVPIHPVNTQTIPMLNQSDANIANAFPGYLAEVQTYSNATVNCQALTSILLDKYLSLPPITLSVAGNTYVDVNSDINLTVGIPASSSASGSFTVTLTSDDTTVAGGATVTFPKGVSSTNVSLQILSASSATITGSGSGLGSASVAVGGLYPRSLVETFHASSLTNSGQIPGIVTGDQVTEWNGDILGTPAYGQANPPTFNANATISGASAVVFVGTNENEMDIPATSDVTSGLTNFSVVAVFEATAVGAGTTGTSWWNDAGIADHELGGTTFDWGLELDSSGYFDWGTGAPDVTLGITNYTAVNPLFHVVIGTYDTLNGISTGSVDDQPAIVITNLFSSPRLPDDIIVGHSHDNANAWLSGQLVELEFWNGALNAAERSNLLSQLKTNYGLIWPDQSQLEITANPVDGEAGTAVQLR